MAHNDSPSPRKRPPPAVAAPWYTAPPPLFAGATIAVIGGGIAGLIAGRALKGRGYRVTIHERDTQAMNQASGNPAAILEPYLAARESPESAFYRAALARALAFYQDLGPDIFLVRGLRRVPVAAAPPQEDDADDSLFFPACGALSPPRIRAALSRDLDIRTGSDITRIQHDGAGWRLHAADTAQPHRADAVVICGGAAAARFLPPEHCPLDPVRGQISYLEAAGITPPPTAVLCGAGYLIPPVNVNGKATLIAGATFDRGDRDLSLRDRDHAENLTQAARLWPAISPEMPVRGGRSALRAYSRDHMPICGPLPDFPRYRAAYAPLKHGPRHKPFPSAPYQPRLYALTGLGARGFLSAPLLGDILGDLLSGAPGAVPDDMRHRLHPGRFMIRDLVRGT